MAQLLFLYQINVISFLGSSYTSKLIIAFENADYSLFVEGNFDFVQEVFSVDELQR